MRVTLPPMFDQDCVWLSKRSTAEPPHEEGPASISLLIVYLASAAGAFLDILRRRLPISSRFFLPRP